MPAWSTSTPTRMSRPRDGVSTFTLPDGLGCESTLSVPCSSFLSCSWPFHWQTVRYYRVASKWCMNNQCYLLYISVCINSTFPGVDAGLIGLSITYSISLTSWCQYGIRSSGEVESLVSFCVTPKIRKHLLIIILVACEMFWV